MHISVERLREKGWSTQEIEHYQEVIRGRKQHPKLLFLEQAGYWIFLLIVLVAAVAGTWLIEPFLLFVTRSQALGLIFVFGLLFGLLGSLIVKDLEELELQHHFVITLIIPISAVLTSVLLSRQVQQLSEVINIAQHNPLLLAIAFSVGSLVPYGILLFIRHKEYGTD